MMYTGQHIDVPALQDMRSLRRAELYNSISRGDCMCSSGTGDTTQDDHWPFLHANKFIVQWRPPRYYESDQEASEATSQAETINLMCYSPTDTVQPQWLVMPPSCPSSPPDITSSSTCVDTTTTTTTTTTSHCAQPPPLHIHLSNRARRLANTSHVQAFNKEQRSNAVQRFLSKRKRRLDGNVPVRKKRACQQPIRPRARGRYMCAADAAAYATKAFSSPKGCSA